MRDGQPFDNTIIGHYVYNVSWSPDGQDILLNRTNRKQNVLEFAACSPDTGKCRAIVHEEWPTGWIENRPRCVSSRTASASSGSRSGTA